MSVIITSVHNFDRSICHVITKMKLKINIVICCNNIITWPVDIKFSMFIIPLGLEPYATYGQYTVCFVYRKTCVI